MQNSANIVRRSTSVVALSVFLFYFPLVQVESVPVNVQFALFAKILSFDRNLKKRVGEEIVLGVLYQRDHMPSLETKEQIEAVVPFLNQIENVPVKFEWIELNGRGNVESVLKTRAVDILYLTPLINVDIASISEYSRRKSVITLTGSETYVAQGLSVGITLKDKKPLPVINLSAARAEGADFDSKLLNLSKVIE